MDRWYGSTVPITGPDFPGPSNVGWDLALQTLEVPINPAPEPGPLALVVSGVLALTPGRSRRSRPSDE